MRRNPDSQPPLCEKWQSCFTLVTVSAVCSLSWALEALYGERKGLYKKKRPRKSQLWLHRLPELRSSTPVLNHTLSRGPVNKFTFCSRRLGLQFWWRTQHSHHTCQNLDSLQRLFLNVLHFKNKYVNREFIMLLVLKWLLIVWLGNVGFYYLMFTY